MKDKKTESIKFKAKAVIYRSNENDFKIIKGIAYDEDGVSEIGKCSIKGNLYDVEDGDEIFAAGNWEDHPKYGMSFRTDSYIKALPATKIGILNYLKNGNIACIDHARAEKIVDIFGLDTLDVLVNKTHLLKEIKGIGKKTVEKIRQSAKENLEQQSIMMAIMMYIQEFGISPAYARRIYEQYGPRSMEVIKTNPYRLAEEVKGVGFLKADEIALKNGIQRDSPFRIESAVLYTIGKMNDEGNVYGDYGIVIAECCGMLGLDASYVKEAVKGLVADKRLINDDNDLYLPKLYYAEVKSAEKLVKLSLSSKKSFYVYDDDINDINTDITYSDEQINVIKRACQSNVIIITGGPGTGKTTVTNGIIQVCHKQKLSVLCAAPTGKATKRMKESTHTDAQTIHKLLELKYNEEDKILTFGRNEKNPLDGDVLIIDETSMIDISLFYSLLKAIPLGMKLIMVGDIDQLPSVGCGNVLSDIIKSGVIPVEKLSVIFRQAEQSDIIKNAHLINAGHTPNLKNKKTGDFFFVNTDGMEPEAVRDKIVKFVCEGLPKCYDVSPDEIQVLAPMKKGHTGVFELNNFIQDKLNKQNKNSPSIPSNGGVLREGDKVMCIKNDYQNMVFNGDIGKIKEIKTTIDVSEDDNDDEKMSVPYFSIDFDGRVICFPLMRSNDFILSYAMTIHKSQGSEYDIVVMPLTNQNYVMLQRNLLYTGLTRAKKIFVLVGQQSAIRTAVHTLKVEKRNTHLDSRLRDEAGLFGLLEA